MADISKKTNGPEPHSQQGFDASLLPDFDREFLSEEHLKAFANALSAPEPSPSTDDLLSTAASLAGSERRGSERRGSAALLGETPNSKSRESLFITAQNDWAPINPSAHKHKRGGWKGRGEKVKGRSRKKLRSTDETREGYLYTLLKYPFLLTVSLWVFGLGASYLLIRLYIWLYEHFIAWRGTREKLRRKLYRAESYEEWVKDAKELDQFLGNDGWKEEDGFAYYDCKTVRRVVEQMRRCRRRVEGNKATMNGSGNGSGGGGNAVGELKALVEACVKNNFVGVENSRLYSQTYYGTKNLVQEFIDEGMFSWILILLRQLLTSGS